MNRHNKEGKASLATTHDRVRAQFGKTAAAYVESEGHAKGAELAAMVELACALLGGLVGKEVLDVATGGGHTALAFARAGARVTATDLTPEMLRIAQGFIENQPDAGALEVTFLAAPAEGLPFAKSSFDVVTCRIAAHHFAAPQAFVLEAARLLKPGGSLLLVDNVAPEDRELAAAMNYIEKARDPSHVRAYSVSQWVGWLAGAGLELTHLSRWRTVKPYQDWLARAQTHAAAGEALETFVLALPETHRAYFEVVAEGNQLQSLSHEAAFLAALRLL